jgi:hypothetical protein
VNDWYDADEKCKLSVIVGDHVAARHACCSMLRVLSLSSFYFIYVL